MKGSEIQVGMILEVANPFYQNINDLIDGRAVVYISKKQDFNCVVEVCRRTADGYTVGTGTNRSILFKHLRKRHSTASVNGTKWWT